MTPRVGDVWVWRSKHHYTYYKIVSIHTSAAIGIILNSSVSGSIGEITNIRYHSFNYGELVSRDE